MAERFNLTAQIQLQAPRNTTQVVNQIKRQLRGVTVDVNVKSNVQQVAKLNKELQGIGKAGDASAKSVNRLNATLAQSARRFSVITIATGSFLALTRAIKNSTVEAIAFERELVKISQVTGRSVQRLSSLTSEVTRLSTSLGTSSSDLLQVSRTLAQAGFSAQKTKQALETLAQTTLAATFDTIQDTTEGAIAVLRQFAAEARASGGEIKFLQSTLDAINSVSKNFAVESGDLITVIRRVGGVFASAGGSVNELIALFTSVRSTTRESAETISTGLRTIFTRIQRTDTVDQLRQLGIELRNSQGQFVGAFEAVRRLSAGLSTLDPRDYRFSDIVEELGGFRQIGKVIPLIQQFNVAQNALNVAQNSSGSIAKDAATAQQSLAVQVTKVKEEFQALLRQFADSSTFRSIAGGALELARAFIQVASALENVLPLITTFIGLRIGQSLAPGVLGLLGGGPRRRNQGGPIGFARGGVVPGTGNRDTVPAMLTPGEFVIKKSSVGKIGADTLAAMNENKYAKGGIIALKPFDRDPPNEPLSASGNINTAVVAGKAGFSADAKGVKELRKNYAAIQSPSRQFSPEFQQLMKTGKLPVSVVGMSVGDQTVGEETEEQIKTKFLNAINSSGNKLRKYFSSLSGEGPVTSSQLSMPDLAKFGIEGVIGNAFEALLARFGAPFDAGSEDVLQRAKIKANNNSAFDFPTGIGVLARGKFAQFANIPTDAKRTLTKAYLQEVVDKKYPNLLAEEYKGFKALKGIETISQKSAEIGAIYRKSRATLGDVAVARLTGLSKNEITRRRKAGEFANFASGGGVSGSDTVPAMLTPGEFVINKKAAQSIGSANLNKMNKQGVVGFNNGGMVGVQRFRRGGVAENDPSFIGPPRPQPVSSRSNLQSLDSIAGAAQQFAFVGAAAASLGAQFSGLDSATQKAISSTAGFATSVLGIGGTLVQIFTSMASASAASAAADTAEAAASNKAAIAGGGFGKAAGTIAIGAVAVASAFEFFAAKARAVAEELAAKNEELLGKVASGEVGVEAGTEQSQRLSLEQLLQENESRAFTEGTNKALIAGAVAAAGAGIAGLVQGAAAGAAGGSVLTPAGTVAGGIGGAAIGLATGAAAGAGVGLVAYNQELERLSGELAEFRARAENSVASLVDITAAGADLAAGLKEADTAVGLSDEQRQDISGRTLDAGLDRINKNFAQASNEFRALAAGAKTSTANLKKGDFKDSPVLAGNLNRAIKTQEQASAQLKNIRERATRELSDSLKQVTGEFTFDELIAQGGQFAKTYQRQRNIILAESAARKQTIQNIIDSAETQEQEKQAKEDLNKAIEAEIIALTSLDTNLRNSVAGSKERFNADIQAAQAARELADRFEGISQFGLEVQNFGQALKNSIAALDNTIAALTDGNINVKIPEISGLKDITRIADPAGVETQIQTLIRDLPRELQGRAIEQAEIVSRGAAIFGDFRKNVIEDFIQNRPQSGVEDTAFIGNILRDLGVESGSSLGQELTAKLTKALAEGNLIEKFNEIFAPFAEEAQKAADNLRESRGLGQLQLDAQARYNAALIELRSKEINARQKLIDVQIKGEELRAKARGESISIERKQAARVARAQIALQGTDVQAGDARGAFNAILRARSARSDIANRLSRPGLGFEEAEKLQKQQLEYTEIIKRAGDELTRLGDQSNRAQEILGKIDEQRNIRQTVGGLVKDFVTAGAKERAGINKAFVGIRAVLQTGTLQNQSESQRQATVSLLERLKDVPLAFAGGQTGGDILEQVIENDALRLGFDEATAKALSQATSKEEKLIQSLDKLTQVTEKAVKLQAEAAGETAAAAATGGLITSNGVVYRAGGGSIFKPKGTDTVPAMLTPGEFVIKKSAVDQIGVGNLQALNSGTQYKQAGGRIRPLFPSINVPGVATGDKRPRDAAGRVFLPPDAIERIRNRTQASSINAREQAIRNYFADPDAQEGDRRFSKFKGGKLINKKSTNEARADLEALMPKILSEVAAINDAYFDAEEEIPKVAKNIITRKYKTAKEAGVALRDNVKLLKTLDDISDKFVEDYENMTSVSKAFKAYPNADPDVIIPHVKYIRDAVKGAKRRRSRAKGGLRRFALDVSNFRVYSFFGLNELDRQDAVKFLLRAAAGSLSPKQRRELGDKFKLKKGESLDEYKNRIANDIFGKFNNPTFKKFNLKKFNLGGNVSGADTVPAMLTPGEFVMSKEAVKSHGVGFMRHLNRGNIPGFNRGGLVGAGNVQYRQQGGQIGGSGGLMLDPSNLSNILDTFNQNFVSSLDTVVQQFSGFSESFTRLAESFSNLSMIHTFNGDLSVAFNITNADAIKNAVAEAVTPKITQLIANELDNRLDKDFRSIA